MIPLPFNITSWLVIEQIIAAGGLLSLTVGFYPIYKEAIKIDIERANNNLRNTVSTQNSVTTGTVYAASVIDSFLNLLDKIRRKKIHDGILLTGGSGTILLFVTYLIQRGVIEINTPWTQQALLTDLFAVILSIVFLEIILAIRLVLLIGSPHKFSSEELEEFIGKL